MSEGRKEKETWERKVKGIEEYTGTVLVTYSAILILIEHKGWGGMVLLSASLDFKGLNEDIWGGTASWFHATWTSWMTVGWGLALSELHFLHLQMRTELRTQYCRGWEKEWEWDKVRMLCRAEHRHIFSQGKMNLSSALVKVRSFPFSLNTPLSWEHSELPSWSHILSLYGPQQGCHSQEPTLLHGLVKTNVLPVQGHHCPPRCSYSSPKLGPPSSPLYQG